MDPLLIDGNTALVHRVPIQLFMKLHGQGRRGKVCGKKQDAEPLCGLDCQRLISTYSAAWYLLQLVPVVKVDIHRAIFMHSSNNAGIVTLAVNVPSC